MASSFSKKIRSETNLSGTLTSNLSTTGLTFTGTLIDNKLGTARTPQSTTLTFTIDKGNERSETILCDSHSTSSGVTTFTINAAGRNMPKYGTGAGSGTGIAHFAGAEIGCVDIAQPLNIIAGQFDALTEPLLGPVYADATARDVAITSPLAGMSAYLTAEGKWTDYIAGAWTDRAQGSFANASETVAGKVELATAAEMGAGTSTGGTGARLVPPNSQIVKTSSGAADENKLAVLNSSGQFNPGFVSGVQINTYTASDTWTKPTGASWVEVICIGAGGGGGGGEGQAAGQDRQGGTAGGGGVLVHKWVKASDLASTVAVTVAAQTTAAATDTDGASGGNSSFGAHVVGYGGGGGAGGNSSLALAGGSGAGTGSVGLVGSASSQVGGGPSITAAVSGMGGGGGGSTAGGIGKSAEYGGGGGGGCAANGGAAFKGGTSIFGGGGGGSGGGVSAANAASAGESGGAVNVWTAVGGGGGAGGAATGAAGTAGTTGDSTKCGTGGGGGGGNTASTGGAGGDGGAIGGGGGGGGAGTSTGGAGGRGGRGGVTVIAYF